MTEPRADGRRGAVLALDQGSHASRACVIDQDRSVLAEAQVPIRTVHGAAGEVEHDAEEIVASLRSAAGTAIAAAVAAAARSGQTGLTIAAAGLATQRSTLVCFDRHRGTALSAAISWQDRRNAAWLASFEVHAGLVRSLTGLPLSPHYGAGKMRWCLEHLPAVQQAHRLGALQIAPLAAYLAARLTGQSARVDPANASRTLLWDSSTHDWSAPLLRLFGIESALLPPCSATRANYGTLRLGAPGVVESAGVVKSAGAMDNIALRAVTGDQSAIPFAFGAPDSRAIYINLGTGAFIQRPVLQRPANPAPLLASVLALERRRAWYCLEGTVNGAGSAAEAFAAQTRADPASLWRELEQLPATVGLPIYVNGIGGLGSPYWRAAQPSYFIGEGTLLERFAAVIESIVLLLAINFDCMRRWGGEPEHVLVSGGLSRSDWLCRRLAACLGVPVLRTVQETTLLGVGALAAPRLFNPAAAPLALRRFEPQQSSAAERTGLAARRERLEARLREPA
ncbi:MAG TPA: FGGY family carbohydrate kinase [Steroidobacteraceae bacterium]|nr:FGGY family carbohydrate kinase [Steroidobacteraceae bacterium]